MTKVEILIDYEKCGLCSNPACVDVCPHGVFEIDDEGKTRVSDIVSCTICRVCEDLCPKKAIKISR